MSLSKCPAPILLESKSKTVGLKVHHEDPAFENEFFLDSFKTINKVSLNVCFLCPASDGRALICCGVPVCADCMRHRHHLLEMDENESELLCPACKEPVARRALESKWGLWDPPCWSETHLSQWVGRVRRARFLAKRKAKAEHDRSMLERGRMLHQRRDELRHQRFLANRIRLNRMPRPIKRPSDPEPVHDRGLFADTSSDSESSRGLFDDSGLDMERRVESGLSESDDDDWSDAEEMERPSVPIVSDAEETVLASVAIDSSDDDDDDDEDDCDADDEDDGDDNEDEWI